MRRENDATDNDIPEKTLGTIFFDRHKMEKQYGKSGWFVLLLN